MIKKTKKQKLPLLWRLKNGCTRNELKFRYPKDAEQETGSPFLCGGAKLSPQVPRVLVGVQVMQGHAIDICQSTVATVPHVFNMFSRRVGTKHDIPSVNTHAVVEPTYVVLKEGDRARNFVNMFPIRRSLLPQAYLGVVFGICWVGVRKHGAFTIFIPSFFDNEPETLVKIVKCRHSRDCVWCCTLTFELTQNDQRDAHISH